MCNAVSRLPLGKRAAVAREKADTLELTGSMMWLWSALHVVCGCSGEFNNATTAGSELIDPDDVAEC